MFLEHHYPKGCESLFGKLHRGDNIFKEKNLIAITNLHEWVNLDEILTQKDSPPTFNQFFLFSDKQEQFHSVLNEKVSTK